MRLKISVLLLLFCFLGPVRAQFDSYKYIVVPTHFENFRKVNQYQTSTLIKYHLTQRGLPAVYEEEQPAEVKIEPCKGAYTRLREDSGMFRTRLVVYWVDCEGKEVFATHEGDSKEKDFDLAYKESLQEAFMSIPVGMYSYQPPVSTGATAATSTTAGAAATTGAAAATTAASAAATGATTTTTTAIASTNTAATSQPPAAATNTAASTPPAAVPTASTTAATTTGAASSASAATAAATATSETELWYAQETSDGFQLVDSTPSIRMKLVRTSQAETFIALVSGEPQGMVVRRGEVWIHEYYSGGSMQQRELRIKF